MAIFDITLGCAKLGVISMQYCRACNMFNGKKCHLVVQSIQALELSSSVSVSVLLASLAWLSLTLTARKLFGSFTLQNAISVVSRYRHMNIIRVEPCS